MLHLTVGELAHLLHSQGYRLGHDDEPWDSFSDDRKAGLLRTAAHTKAIMNELEKMEQRGDTNE